MNIQHRWKTIQTDYQDSGLVHNMLDNFENATLLIKLGLPSTLQHTNTHKEISQNRTFWICSLEWNNLKMQLFCISVDGELFVSGTFWIRLHHFVMWFNFSSLSWSLIQHGRQHDVFCVVDNNFFFHRLFRVKYCFSSHEYCMPENQEWLETITGVKGYKESNATFSTLQAETLLD